MAYANRICEIMFKLISGEKVTTKGLSEEFNVTQRAIQHDLKERLPDKIQYHLINQNGYYYLDPLTITNFFPEHIQKILALVNSSEVLPHKLTENGLQKLLSYEKNNAPFVVHASRRSVLTEIMKQNYALLENAINHSLKIRFNYKKKQEEKQYKEIEPYKLIDYQGIWYLAAVDGEKIKTLKHLY